VPELTAIWPSLERQKTDTSCLLSNNSQ
jgi:hypothetical protein